jgi:hypothetical protein
MKGPTGAKMQTSLCRKHDLDQHKKNTGKMKACFVVQGNGHMPGRDFLETFEPTLGKDLIQI